MDGIKPANIFNLNKNLNVAAYNLREMKKEEFKILKKILRINSLNNMEIIEKLRDYYISQKNKETINPKDFVKDMLTLYIIPITFGIINIYTAISINNSLENSIINIAYIVFIAVVILSIIFIIYLILEIKKFSSTNYYTIPRLEKLMLEIMIEKLAKEEKRNVPQKRNLKKDNERI